MRSGAHHVYIFSDCHFLFATAVIISTLSLKASEEVELGVFVNGHGFGGGGRAVSAVEAGHVLRVPLCIWD